MRIGSRASSGNVESRQRLDRRRPDLRGGIVRTLEDRPDAPGHPARGDCPRPSTAPARTMTSWCAEAAISGSTAAVPIRPSATTASRRIRSLLSPEQADQVGDGGFGVGPDPPQGHDDFRSHVFLLLLQQAAQPLDRRLADGRQGQGGTIVLVRLFLSLASVVGAQGVNERGDGRGRVGPQRGDRVEDGQPHLAVLLLHQPIDQHGQRVALHVSVGRPDRGRRVRRTSTFSALQVLDQSIRHDPAAARPGPRRVWPSGPQTATSSIARIELRIHSGSVLIRDHDSTPRSWDSAVGSNHHASRPGSGSVLSPKRSTGTPRLLQHGQQQVGHRCLRPALQVLARSQGAAALAEHDDRQVDVVVAVAVADAAAVEDHRVVEQRRPVRPPRRSSSFRSCRPGSRYGSGRSRGASGSSPPRRRGARARGGRR